MRLDPCATGMGGGGWCVWPSASALQLLLWFGQGPLHVIWRKTGMGTLCPLHKAWGGGAENGISRDAAWYDGAAGQSVSWQLATSCHGVHHPAAPASGHLTHARRMPSTTPLPAPTLLHPHAPPLPHAPTRTLSFGPRAPCCARPTHDPGFGGDHNCRLRVFPHLLCESPEGGGF